MKVKSLFAAPLTAALVLNLACSDETADPIGQNTLRDITVPDLSENILLAYEQTVFVESEDLSITFREFSESRCPKGAVCIWEGEGIVELVIENGEGDVASALPVIRPGRDSERYTWLKAYVMDYRITLLELEPYPDLDDPSDPEEYTALLDIEKIPDPSGCDHVMFTQGDPSAMCRAELTIRGGAIDGIVLEIYVNYGGGCGDHEFMLLGKPNFMESYPVQIDLYVHHRNIDDYCDAIVSDTLCLDVRRVAELYEGIYQSCDDILINVLDCNLNDPEEKFQVLLRP
ncbi:MAG: hypothetical protein KAU49_07685 [Candidatus Krumholzibacteria bacterium]|nr:hypothetical protein [Candidatus Krumholzibacteria bacterium]